MQELVLSSFGDQEAEIPSRIPARWRVCALGCLAGFLLGVAPASAVTIGFDASDGNFRPTTALGTMDLDLTLGDLIASDTDGVLLPLGVAVAAEATLTDSSGRVQTTTFMLDPRFSTSRVCSASKPARARRSAWFFSSRRVISSWRAASEAGTRDARRPSRGSIE
jgi:hypothetical protein